MKRILTIVLTAVIFSTAVLCGCSKSPSEQSSATAAVQEATDTTVKTTGSKIQIHDSVLGEIWITELAGVPLNNLDNDNFTSDATFKYYSENGSPASTEGIDVSAYSGDIDWDKVKATGVDFVMVRLGGRGYGESGTLYADERAAEYLTGAKQAGLKVGAYFFSQAINGEEAAEEAQYAHTLLGDIQLDYPLAFDWEIIKNEDARTDSVTPAQLTACAKSFCETARALGYSPIIYSSSSELYFKYDLTALTDYDIWYVEYAAYPTFYYGFSMWQYSDSSHIDGIEGTVDLNICFTNVAKYD